MRRGELVQLKAADIDKELMLVHIREGKGKRDRNVPVSPKLLDALREYWRWMNRLPMCSPQWSTASARKLTTRRPRAVLYADELLPDSRTAGDGDRPAIPRGYSPSVCQFVRSGRPDVASPYALSPRNPQQYTPSRRLHRHCLSCAESLAPGILFSAPQRLCVEDSLRRMSHRQIRYTARSAAAMMVKRTAYR
jgi:hypothetical protein